MSAAAVSAAEAAVIAAIFSDEVIIPIGIVLPDGRVPLQGTWTADDWEQLDHSTARYEIIQGVLYMSKSPSLLHQYILLQLTLSVCAPVRRANLGHCFFAPTGLFMPNAKPLQPDFLFVKRDDPNVVFHEKGVYGIPTLIIEILSSNRQYDEITKLQAYAQAGVPEYAILNLQLARMVVYSQPERGLYRQMTTYSIDESVTFQSLPDVSFTLRDLLTGAPDIAP
jgi:Uma2 family endonuclease